MSSPSQCKRKRESAPSAKFVTKRTKRLVAEEKRLLETNLENIVAFSIDNKKLHWKGYFRGRVDSWLKEDETISFEIKCHPLHPFKPPIFRFDKPLPNHPMCNGGTLPMLDILEDNIWSPIITMEKLLVSIYNVLLEGV